MKSHLLIALCAIITLGFTTDKNHLRTEYYNNLQFLKQASAPQKVEMIMTRRLQRTDKVISQGILFTYKSRKAKSVKISGNFSFWKKLSMKRSKNGIWYYYLDTSGLKKEVKYKFFADGIWLMDPENSTRIDDGIGSYLSVVNPIESSQKKSITYRIIERGAVEFRVFRPDAQLIALVGDFNHWNPENDLMEKGKDGIWRLKKRISPGIYRYKFVINGKWTPDFYNEKSGRDNTGNICSIIEIK